jgi:hypothetical protein
VLPSAGLPSRAPSLLPCICDRGSGAESDARKCRSSASLLSSILEADKRLSVNISSVTPEQHVPHLARQSASFDSDLTQSSLNRFVTTRQPVVRWIACQENSWGPGA